MFENMEFYCVEHLPFDLIMQTVFYLKQQLIVWWRRHKGLAWYQNNEWSWLVSHLFWYCDFSLTFTSNRRFTLFPR